MDGSATSEDRLEKTRCVASYEADELHQRRSAKVMTSEMARFQIRPHLLAEEEPS